MGPLEPDILSRIAGDPELWRDFDALCDLGGRFAGTESEERAIDLMATLGEAASGVRARSLPVAYDGWSAVSASLRVAGGESEVCCALVRSVPTPAGGLTAEVVDLGRGTPESFAAHVAELTGRIALVRHELMFADGMIHRRVKYEMARAAGAVGFLIAGPAPGSAVAGSSGRSGPDGIPAAGISPEAAHRLRRTARGWPEATLSIETREQPMTTRTLLFDMPGDIDEWVVLSAHVDGHILAESAIDNATGLASALAIARALARSGRRPRRGLRLAIFSVEEWALTGSARYVAALSEDERRGIALNVNLDSIAGSRNLTALTSGFSGLEPFLLGVAEANGEALSLHRPFMANSDHANFAKAGIPALRLVAGFDEPEAELRWLLTDRDSRALVREADLRSATILAAAITAAAQDADGGTVAAWRSMDRS